MKSECDGFKALMVNDLHASVHENGYVLLGIHHITSKVVDTFV